MGIASEMYESRRKRGAGGAKGRQYQAVGPEWRPGGKDLRGTSGTPPTVWFGRAGNSCCEGEMKDRRV